MIIDTPGIGDSRNRDTKHIAEMVASLKKVGYVNAFLIVINSEEHRFSEQMQGSIKIFSQMFSTEFFTNTLLVFTRFGHDKRSIFER